MLLDRAILALASLNRLVRKAATTLARAETALVALRDADAIDWRTHLDRQSADYLMRQGAAAQRWDGKSVVGFEAWAKSDEEEPS
jgi:hypothetical protein